MKFSELTLDMFRMLQTLEREPQEDLTNQIYDASPAPGRQPFVSLSADDPLNIKFGALWHYLNSHLKEVFQVNKFWPFKIEMM